MKKGKVSEPRRYADAAGAKKSSLEKGKGEKPSLRNGEKKPPPSAKEVFEGSPEGTTKLVQRQGGKGKVFIETRNLWRGKATSRSPPDGYQKKRKGRKFTTSRQGKKTTPAMRERTCWRQSTIQRSTARERVCPGGKRSDRKHATRKSKGGRESLPGEGKKVLLISGKKKGKSP